MTTIRIALVGFLTLSLGVCRSSRASGPPAASAPDQSGPSQAPEILRSAGTGPGLCVHLGVTDGKTTGELARNGGFLVHGLSADSVAAARAREFLQAEGLYGQASVECGALGRLPYADNLANLVVTEDLPRMLDHGLSLTEILRVLRPGGVACLGVTPEQRKGVEDRLAPAGIKDYRLDGRSRLWLVFKKPRPAGMDEWTHYQHGPEGSRVSQDTMAPVSCLHWLAGPTYAAIAGSNVLGGNEYEAMVSGGGRF